MLKTKLNLPTFDLKLIIKDNKEYVFDPIRKKLILLTEEEWVRQNIIQFLVINLNYPPSLMGVEKQIKVFDTKKRPDIIVFDTNLNAKMIVECKRPKIKIDKNTLNQAIDYFLKLKAEYFLLTNGLNHYCCKTNDNKCEFLNQIPKFKNL